jgi:hypothetical protein
MPLTLDRDDERRLARELFNHVWDLLERPARTEEQDDEMIHAAHASAFHWARIGEHVHRARGEWQCSRVYAVLGRPEPALYHARRCLELCEEAPVEEFDLPFAHEALARAHAVAGEEAEAARHLEIARRLAGAIRDGEDRGIVLADLRTVPVEAADGVHPVVPSREEVRAVLAGLAGGTITPEAASQWASPWLAHGAPPIPDDALHEALELLGSADVKIDGETYLHVTDDFDDWLGDFDAATSA